MAEDRSAGVEAAARPLSPRGERNAAGATALAERPRLVNRRFDVQALDGEAALDSPCSVDFDTLSSRIEAFKVFSSSSVLTRFTGSIGLSGGTSGSLSGTMAGLLARENKLIILMLSTPLSSTTFKKDSS